MVCNNMNMVFVICNETNLVVAGTLVAPVGFLWVDVATGIFTACVDAATFGLIFLPVGSHWLGFKCSSSSLTRALVIQSNLAIRNGLIRNLLVLSPHCKFVSLQFLQPFSIDSADFPCRDPAISSPRSFYGQNICSVALWLLPRTISGPARKGRFLNKRHTSLLHPTLHELEW